MTEFKTKLITQSTINAVVLTGILSFLMHPFVMFGYKFPDMGFLAWFHLVPLLLGMHRYRFRHKFILAFMSGLIAHYGTFYWLMTAMQKFGGLNFFEGLGTMTAMFIFLSVLFALFISFASWNNHFIKLQLFVLLPLFMVCRDYLIGHGPLGGFPWGIALYSQGEWIQFFQWIDVTGPMGLGFFIYLINGLIADGLMLFIHRKQIDKMVSRFLVVFVLFVLSLYLSFLSSDSYEKNKISSGSVNLALIQGNISQDIKWDPFKAQDNLDVHLKLSNTAVKDHADVVIWPETSYPYSLDFDKLATETFLDKTQLLSPILFGAIVTKRQGHGRREILNSVLYADTTAKFSGIYSKMHLVPFGEYLPFKEYLGYLDSLTQGVGEFTPGADGYKIFEINGIKYGSLICFEDIFPEHAREYALLSSDILINYTNDAWYGNTSAQHQHLVFSQFRALENRRYLARSTNTGLTAVINPRGEVISTIAPFRRSYLLQNLKIDRASSYYTRNGDFWVWVVIGITTVLFLYTTIKCRLGPVKIKF